MKISVFEHPNGTIFTRTIAQNPAPGSPSDLLPEETEDQRYERLVSINPRGATRRADIDHTDMPSGHGKFKDARRWRGMAVVIDMPLAQDIHMDRIRIKRDEELVRLDIDYIRADEDNDQAEKTRLANEKRTLRDLPQTFDLTGATTADDLDVLWPPGLPR